MKSSSACPSFLPALVDAAEGRPSAELEAHLRDCAGCRSELDELGASLEALAPPPAPEPGPWLAPKIRARHEARAPRLRLARWALPALVPVALLVTLLWTGPGARPGRAGLGSLEAVEAEVAQLDPTEVERVLANLQGRTAASAALPVSDEGEAADATISGLARSLAETDEEILNTVLAETSLGYDDYGYDGSLDLDDELELILETIPG